MSLFSKPSLSDQLENRRALLDEVFGQGAYEITSTEADDAIVRSDKLEWRLGVDPRDGSLGGMIAAILGKPWEEQSTPYMWAKFLGEETPPLPRNASGKVALSLEEQIEREIQLVRRISVDIFADPQKTRDAAFFVRGYQTAYTDYYSGSWDTQA